MIVRFQYSSDADADVLADYVLALLRHDGDVEAIRKLFEEEIPDFLREGMIAYLYKLAFHLRFLPLFPLRFPSPMAACAQDIVAVPMC